MEEKGSPSDKRFDKDSQVPTLQPLQTGIDETRMLKYLNALEQDADDHWNAPGPKGINLKERRKQNIKYLFGRQLLGRDLKRYESEFLDNTIYEFEAMLKALSVSKMPDIIVDAGEAETEQKKLTAELLTKANENRMLDRKFRKNLGILFKHLPAYFISVYKYRWDPAKNKIGDIAEEVINPESIVVDHTALSADPDDMQFIIHYIEKTAREWITMFPKKEEDIKEFVAEQNQDIVGDDKEDWLMAQKIKVAEFWYDWIEKPEEFDTENPSFDYMSAVAWKLGDDIMLDNIKNPNWDYEGHQNISINGEPVPPEMMQQIIMSGQQPEGFKVETIFNNYFQTAKKPFIFMSFDQFLRSAIDETSRIEQVIPIQKSVDTVEREMDHMIRRHKGKHVWSKGSGITKKDLKKLDMDNPDADIVGVSGSLSEVHAFIQPVMPPGEAFVHAREKRERIFSKVGVHGATRGEIQTSTATTNQISREADFTKSDDVVDETILHVTTEVAKARLHMMKLRYTEEHWKKLVGMDAKYLDLRLDNDSIDDGLEVTVTASTTDKLRAERNAQQMAQLGLTEPISFYKDMGIPDAESRAEMLFLKETNPNLYYQKFILKKDISDMADQVVQAAQPQGQPGQTTQEPQVPSPQDTSNIATQPQGSPRNLVGRAASGIRNMLS